MERPIWFIFPLQLINVPSANFNQILFSKWTRTSSGQKINKNACMRAQRTPPRVITTVHIDLPYNLYPCVFRASGQASIRKRRIGKSRRDCTNNVWPARSSASSIKILGIVVPSSTDIWAVLLFSVADAPVKITQQKREEERRREGGERMKHKTLWAFQVSTLHGHRSSLNANALLLYANSRNHIGEMQ